jgi:hypothetical protein
MKITILIGDPLSTMLTTLHYNTLHYDTLFYGILTLRQDASHKDTRSLHPNETSLEQTHNTHLDSRFGTAIRSHDTSDMTRGDLHYTLTRTASSHNHCRNRASIRIAHAHSFPPSIYHTHSPLPAHGLRLYESTQHSRLHAPHDAHIDYPNTCRSRSRYATDNHSFRQTTPPRALDHYYGRTRRSMTSLPHSDAEHSDRCNSQTTSRLLSALLTPPCCTISSSQHCTTYTPSTVSLANTTSTPRADKTNHTCDSTTIHRLHPPNYPPTLHTPTAYALNYYLTSQTYSTCTAFYLLFIIVLNAILYFAYYHIFQFFTFYIPYHAYYIILILFIYYTMRNDLPFFI